MAAGRRRLCYAKGLIADDNKVDVVISCKIEDDGMPNEGLFRDIKYKFVCGKLDNTQKCSAITKLIAHLHIDYIKSFLYALRNIKKGDIVYCYFYSISFHLLLILATKIKKAKIVRELCEYPYVFDKQTMHIRLNRWFELNFVFPLFDGFIPISHSLCELADQYKSKRAKCIIVPILVEDAIEPTDDVVSPYNVPYIIHTGTMLEQKDGISIILKAFAKVLKKQNIRLVFTGPHANNNCPYIGLIRELGIEDNVELLGMVSMEEVNRLQQFASLSIVYKPNNLQTRNCFPTKLGEVLLNGIPVIITDVGDANRYLKDGESAYIVKDGNIQQLSDRIMDVLSNPIRSHEIGMNGKSIAQRDFNPIIQGKLLSEFYKKL